VPTSCKVFPSAACAVGQSARLHKNRAKGTGGHAWDAPDFHASVSGHVRYLVSLFHPSPCIALPAPACRSGFFVRAREVGIAKVAGWGLFPFSVAAKGTGVR
jgi:hypothetical protein